MLPTPKRTQWACGMTTPFDGPVVPEVYMTQAVSAARGNGPSHSGADCHPVRSTTSGPAADPRASRTARVPASSATTNRAPQSSSWWARNEPSRAVLTGTMTAPSRPRPSHTRTKSRPLGSSTATASPGPTPRDASRDATRRASRAAAAYDSEPCPMTWTSSRPPSSSARCSSASGSAQRVTSSSNMTARQPLSRGDPRVAGRHRMRRDVVARPTAGPGTRASVSGMSLRDAFGTDILVTGWGHTRFGRLDEQSLEDLVVSAAGEALECAGVDPGQVDEIVLGTFNSGMWPLGFASSLALQVSDDLANVPATRVENACASGSAAVHQGVKSLLAGTARTVLVIGAEKMTHAPADVVGAALLGADYELAGRASTTGFAGLFADVARHYEKLHGPVGDTLGSIAAKNHRNGVLNPYAQLRKDLGEDFCRTVSDRNPVGVSTRCVSPASATPTTSCPLPSGTRSPSRGPRPPGSARSPWRTSTSPASTSSSCTTASPSPSSSSTRRSASRRGARGTASSRPAPCTATAGCRSTSPAASRPRATPSAPRGSHSTCWPRCSCPARPVTCSCRRRAGLPSTTWAASQWR